MWVYIQSEPGLYTVGFYSPDGEWHTDSDHNTKSAAAARIHYLNGGEDESGTDLAENVSIWGGK